MDGCFYFIWVKKIRVKFLPVFQSGTTIVDIHQQCVRIPVAPQPCQHLVLPDLNFSHTEVSRMVSHGNFNWFFSDDE